MKRRRRAATTRGQCKFLIETLTSFFTSFCTSFYFSFSCFHDLSYRLGPLAPLQTPRRPAKQPIRTRRPVLRSREEHLVPFITHPRLLTAPMIMVISLLLRVVPITRSPPINTRAIQRLLDVSRQILLLAQMNVGSGSTKLSSRSSLCYTSRCCKGGLT
ncbi:hypothetical protein BKA70DRAFT_460379 [Coprinopsis sp. MPI-PUGE-AT-0042]|nr:hypothetical protein BKA70DRAFT_460379 [Coprinopsis sp. MPI-PUGE-AT-0042]